MGEERPLTAADRMPEDGDCLKRRFYHCGTWIEEVLECIHEPREYGFKPHNSVLVMPLVWTGNLRPMFRVCPREALVYTRRKDGGTITTTEPQTAAEAGG